MIIPRLLARPEKETPHCCNNVRRIRYPSAPHSLSLLMESYLSGESEEHLLDLLGFQFLSGKRSLGLFSTSSPEEGALARGLFVASASSKTILARYKLSLSRSSALFSSAWREACGKRRAEREKRLLQGQKSFPHLLFHVQPGEGRRLDELIFALREKDVLVCNSRQEFYAQAKSSFAAGGRKEEEGGRIITQEEGGETGEKPLRLLTLVEFYYRARVRVCVCTSPEDEIYGAIPTLLATERNERTKWPQVFFPFGQAEPGQRRRHISAG